MTEDRGKKAADRAARAAVGSGFEFAASVGAFTVGGYFLDRWQGTSPTWTLVGALIGFVGGGYNLYKATRGMVRTGARSGRSGSVGGQRLETGATPVSNDRRADSGGVHEHVPAFKQEPKRPARDFGMFGRTEVSEEEMVGEDELKWPEDASADDTIRAEEDEEGPRGG